MNREEVLELIEAVVRPLREKVDYLEKENEKLKIQITTQNYEPQRLRSSMLIAIKFHVSSIKSQKRKTKLMERDLLRLRKEIRSLFGAQQEGLGTKHPLISVSILLF